MKRAIMLTIAAVFLLGATGTAMAAKKVKVWGSVLEAADHYQPYQRLRSRLLRQGYTEHEPSVQPYYYFVMPTDDHVEAEVTVSFSKRTGGQYSLETHWVSITIVVWELIDEGGFVGLDHSIEEMYAL